ncbi:MMPL family transporter [Phytoactinopolyspora halotolerans]|uniref:MMPL family transporter n=1 Tax=Phytoactinopolyspora halotolerans TaxID=1981512 RepID=A0A6L9S407_9ACTN|nr:MMPL family transporter [Phytoactinopolyspora halotolerans]NED99187.1 MMPL family transporter [Phytoactinopolyspora halotolerans]
MLTRLASGVVRRARLVLLLGAAALAGAVVLGMGAFGKLQTEGFNDPAAESSLAADVIDERFGGSADLVFVLDAGAGTVDDPDVQAAGGELTEQLAADPGLGWVTSYWQTGAPSMRSTDGSKAMIVASLADGEAATYIDEYSGANGPLQVTVGGRAVLGEDTPEQVGQDLLTAEMIAVPLILFCLVLAFGTVAAAVLPLVVGAIAIMGTFGELSILGGVTDVSVFAINLTTALGLALGIDYALLMVSRYREELGRGLAVHDAVVRTVATAGRTIVFSGLAVTAALAVLLMFPLYFLRSFGYAGIGVVVISVVGAVVVLPALLALLGTRVNALRLPWARSVTRGSEAPFWGRLAERVMRRPIAAGGAVTLLLVAAATPLLQISFGTPDDRVLPESTASRQVGDALRTDFATNDTAAIEVVTEEPVAEDALAGYGEQLSNLSAVERVDTSVGTFVDGALVPDAPVVPGLSAGTAERLSVVADVDPRSEEARAIVDDVRGVTPPAGVTTLVGGETATLVDSLRAVSDRLPLAAALIVLTTVVILFLFTGSIVQPIRAVISNVLTLGATLGLLVLVFQEGYGSSLLGFTPVPLDMAMIVLLFCIVFGLSTDYEVFMMSRIKERRDAGASVEEATAYGLTHTGRIVTVAAALIAIVFFSFLTSQVSFLQLFGLGAGVAILIDATLVRGVLVPASMRLLGQWSWYSPGVLKRVHDRIGLSEA